MMKLRQLFLIVLAVGAAVFGMMTTVNAAGKTTDLTAVEYTVGTDIKPGQCIVTPTNGTSGNFTSSTGDSNVVLGDPNADMGTDMYVSSYTLDLKKKVNISLRGVTTHFEAVTKRRAIKSGDLHAVVYKMGKDIKRGKYKITAVEGSGSLVSTKNGCINEMMGTDSQDGMYVQSYNMKLRTGQVIMTSLKLIKLERR
ncbi:hypothetical protein [Weissella cibaria]|uniref:hypothetical protein n=1 Tax=Weissella cibaria TaxID=137591 RepID=UPI001FD6E27F|nr:hypothetical protein [Weissella cibaria]